MLGWLIGAGIALVGVCAILLAIVLSKRAGSRRTISRENLTIDISQLEVRGPNSNGPYLEVYGIPSRLAVLILAPLGRGASLPPVDQLRGTVDLILPDFSLVLDVDRPIFRKWEPQLSAHGFPQLFTHNLALPGNKGQGTPWCGIAGRFRGPDGPLLVGLILCADKPNSLSQIQIEHEGHWHDVLRLRRGPA